MLRKTISRLFILILAIILIMTCAYMLAGHDGLTVAAILLLIVGPLI